MVAESVDASWDSHPLKMEIALLLQAAMIVFTYTVVIGIANGTDVVTFGRRAVLAHVHAGTLGWITMCVFAASFWLFAMGERPGNISIRAARVLTGMSIVTLPAFALTFAATFGSVRAIGGAVAMVPIVGLFIWMLDRMRHVELTIAHVGMLAAAGTSLVGGILGVLLGIKIASGWDVAPSGISDAHPGTMVIGFLIPVGMALAEWGFTWPKLAPAGRLGVAQMALPFGGGLLLMVSLLLDITPLGPIAALLELAGVAIFGRRLWPEFRRTAWRDATAARFAAACAVAIVADILFINYLAARYKGEFDDVPAHLLLGLDHTMFIGVMTNAILGLLLATVGVTRRWRWFDQAVFAGMNGGLIVFVGGLLADEAVLKQISTPVIGAAILLGLVSCTARLWVREEERAAEGSRAPLPVEP